MALRLRNTGLVAGIAALALAALLGWAWADGGEQPLRVISEPVTIPGANP
ncbi:MAG: hypothetical protein RL702_2554 [Pseudomonadota bacterium]